MSTTNTTRRAVAPASPSLSAEQALYREEKAKRETTPKANAPKAELPKAKPQTKRTHNSKGLRLAIGLPCLCGCGRPTHTPAARFLSGHDAILRRTMRNAGLDPQSLPDVVRPFYEDGETVAGMRLAEDPDTGTLVLLDVKVGGPEF